MPAIRRFAIVFVLVAGAGATVASNAVDSPSVTGEGGPFTVTLTPGAPDAQVTFTATLDAQAPIIEGSGEVGVGVQLDPAAIAQLTFGLTSDVTGETNETDILDPAVQDQARVGVPAFEGCSGTSPCEEAFVAHFVRFEEAPEGDLEVTWFVDGLVGVTLAADEDATGSLAFTVE